MSIQGDVSKGNSVVNANKLGKTTKWLDITLSSGTNFTLTSTPNARARIYADSDGNWFLDAQIKVIGDIATASFFYITVDNITFKNSERQNFSGSIDDNTYAGIKGSLFVQPNTSTLAYNLTTNPTGETGKNIFITLENIELEEEPTIYTVPANMESADIQVSIPEATATEAGLVKANPWQKKTASTNTVAAGSETMVSFSGMDASKHYKITYQTAVRSSNSTADAECTFTIGAYTTRTFRSARNATNYSKVGVSISEIVTGVTSVNIVGTAITNGFITETQVAFIEELNNYTAQVAIF